MAGTQEKIQLLLRIAHRLNEAGVEWALGASMLLYFKGITSDFHDIDLMVADRDAECVRTILSEMGESGSSDSIPNPMYRTKVGDLKKTACFLLSALYFCYNGLLSVGDKRVP